MAYNEIQIKRQNLVDAAMIKFSLIEEKYGATRQGLNLLQKELEKLAENKELFICPNEFKPAARGTFKDFVAYKLNKEDGTERALYVSLALPGKTSPPHNHKNWAVLVGLKGVEINHIYEKSKDGFKRIDTIAVGPDVSVGLLGDDIHSIDVQGQGDEPVWQLRFYERALDKQTDREQFDESGSTSNFAPNPNTPNAAIAA